MASSSSSTRGKSDFKWTDDEAELLLNVTHNYKIAKITENVDWESGDYYCHDLDTFYYMPTRDS